MSWHPYILDPENDDVASANWVQSARGKSKRSVQRLVAECGPQVPPRGGDLRLRPEPGGKTRLEITISEDCEALLGEAMDLDGHRESEAAEILERALGDYVVRRKAERYGQSPRPQKNPRPCDPDAVSTRTKRQVYQRDGGAL